MKEFLSEKDIDALGLYSREHRRRLRKQGKFPLPTKPAGPKGQGFTARKVIEEYMAGGKANESAA